MIDIIYRTVKPPHLKKFQIMRNIKNLMSQVVFIYLDWSFIKQIIASPPLSSIGGNRFSKECCLGEWVTSSSLGRDDKNLGRSFEWEEPSVKMPRINAFSGNVNSINLKLWLILKDKISDQDHFNDCNLGVEISGK